MRRRREREREQELRDQLSLVKGMAALARRDNAEALDAGKAPPYSSEDLVMLRRRVHEAAAAARAEGVAIGDIVGPGVGVGDFPG